MTRYYSKKYKNNNRLITEHVIALGKQPNEEGEYPMAEMEIKHRTARETPNFDIEHGTPTRVKNESYGDRKVHEATGYRSHELEGYTAHYAAEAANNIEEYKAHPEYGLRGRRHAGISYAKNIREIRQQTSQLFTPTPASTKIDAAFSHSSMRATVPVMGAYFHQKYGDLTASDDLSEHSSRMARHAERMGLPVKPNEDNPDLQVTNSFDFRDASNYRSDLNESWDRIPDATMRSAKEHYKEIRGLKKTPKPLSSQFDQPRLPGME